MDRYYLNIIEQMGLTIPNKEEEIVHVYKEGELINTIDMNENNFVYEENGKEGKRAYVEEGVQSLFVTEPGVFYVTSDNSYFRTKFNLTIYSEKRDNILHIQIDLKPHKGSPMVAEVTVWPHFIRNEFTMEYFYFRIFPEYGETYLIKYGRGEKPQKQEIDLEECTRANIINYIINYINSTELADDKEMQKGVAMILPALNKGVGDMLEYCKSYTSRNRKKR